MKKVILIIAVLFIGFRMYSQSLFKYKLSFEYKNRISLTSPYFDVSNNPKNLLFGGDLVMNYKLNRSFSLGAIGSFSNHNFLQKYVYFDAQSKEIQRNYELNFNKLSMGAQLNYYFYGNVAPLGNSIGMYYILDDYTVEDYNEFHAYLQRKPSDDFVTDEEIKYQVHYLGFDLNYVALLSKKHAIYLKYGAGFALPVFSQIIDYTVNSIGFEKYSQLSSIYDDFDFLSNFRRKRVFSINLGLGILIK